MKIVGLAGGLASGKDTVAELFAERGIKAVDADIISRELTADGSPAVIDIVARFGEGITKENGGIDRAKLRDLVFHNKQELDWLEKFLHPLIRDRIKQEVQQLATASNNVYCLLIAPLLLETGLYKMCDKIIVIDVLMEQQVQRAQLRDQATGMTQDIATKIIKRQLPQDDKLKLADHILDNSGDVSHLKHQVEELHQQLINNFQAS
ncbi:MAG: dephospho-CoA kinase [Candidatus Portiera sp.]|nr:dephospho-CoA kinase [Portiera sp.]